MQKTFTFTDGKEMPQFLSKSDFMLWVKTLKGTISLALLPTQNVSLQQAVKDFRREKVVFNNVAFIPDACNDYRCEMFELTLSEFASRMILMAPDSCAEEYSSSYRNISDMVMQSSCRTSAGADSFFILQSLFQVPGSVLSQRAASDDPPIVIDLVLDQSKSDQGSSRELKSIIKVWNFFSLYDIDIMDNCPSDQKDPMPWLDLETIITESYSFKTTERTRKMEILLTLTSVTE
jgi:hypothetical protein